MKQASLGLLLLALTPFFALGQKLQSDSEFEGFKGRVKTVTVEKASLTQSADKAVEAARQLQKMLTFDADGNFVLDKVYDHLGEEFDLRTYSFIDGERVVKHDVLSKRVISVTAGPGKKPVKPRDLRYSAKLKYKYDNHGNRTEMAWLSPDGTRYLRYVYKLGGNRKEVLVYREDGSLSHGYVEMLDDKGNEVETGDVSTPDRGSGLKTKYTYLEFDPQGNWIKRTGSRGDSSWINYRTITYY